MRRRAMDFATLVVGGTSTEKVIEEGVDRVEVVEEEGKGRSRSLKNRSWNPERNHLDTLQLFSIEVILCLSAPARLMKTVANHTIVQNMITNRKNE